MLKRQNKRNERGTSMNEIDGLTKRVESIEETLVSVRENMVKHDILTEQCVKSYERLSETLDRVTATMVDITQSLKTSQRDIDETKEEVKETKEEIREIKERVDEVDSKSKLDVLEWLKSNWITLAALVGGGSLAVDKVIDIFGR